MVVALMDVNRPIYLHIQIECIILNKGCSWQPGWLSVPDVSTDSINGLKYCSSFIDNTLKEFL